MKASKINSIENVTKNSNFLIEHNLIGNPEETFYSLGIKDKNIFSEQYQSTILKDHLLDSLLFKLPFSTKNIFLSESFSKLVKSYAEGLECNLATYQNFLIKSELSMMPSFLKLHQTLSYQGLTIAYKEKNKCNIIYLLDAFNVNLIENFKNQLYKFNSLKKQTSYIYSGTPFHPFPLYFSQNLNGMIITAHKLTDPISLNNIFPKQKKRLLSDLLWEFSLWENSECNFQKIKKFLTTQKLIANWHLCFFNNKGEVLSWRYENDQSQFNFLHLDNYPFLIFHDQSYSSQANQTNPTTTTYTYIKTHAKEEFLQDYFSRLINKSKDSSLSHRDLLKEFIEHSKLNINQQKLYCSPLTEKTVSFISLSSEDEGIISTNPFTLLDGKNYYSFKHWHQQFPLVKQPINLDINITTTQNQYNKILKKLSISQNINDETLIIHYLQLLIVMANNLEEKLLLDFFLQLYLVKNYQSTDELHFIYLKLIKHFHHLPLILQDHAVIILLLIEKILDLPLSQDNKIFYDKKLQAIFLKIKINPPLKAKLLLKIFKPTFDQLSVQYSFKI